MPPLLPNVNAVVNATSLYQPAKTYPVFVELSGIVTVPPEDTLTLATVLPPLLSKDTVYPEDAGVGTGSGEIVGVVTGEGLSCDCGVASGCVGISSEFGEGIGTVLSGEVLS